MCVCVWVCIRWHFETIYLFVAVCWRHRWEKVLPMQNETQTKHRARSQRRHGRMPAWAHELMGVARRELWLLLHTSGVVRRRPRLTSLLLLLILTLCWCRWRWQLHWFMALSLSPSLPPFRSLPCLSLWSFLGWNLIHQATWWCRPNPFLRRLFPLTVLQLMNTRSGTHTRIRIRNLIAVLCVQLVNWALANHTGLSLATPAPQPTPNPAWF